jgi:thiamine biosynthesis lipoprotein ApbE
MTADALASSVSVLSVEDGLRLVDATPGAAALILRVESEEARTWESRRFAKLDFAPRP